MTQNLSPSLPKRLAGVTFFVLVLLGVLAYFKFTQISELIASGSIPQPPTAVTVAKATTQSWTPRIQAVGSMVASEGVELTSESSGIIQEIAFESGEQVQKGQLLFKLDDSAEQAALASAEASYRAANAQLKRSQQLLKNKYVSQNDIEQQRAAVDLAQAQINSAKVAINKKNIKAPFSGTAGIRQVSLGDLVSPGTRLVSLQNISKLYLDFTLPEKQLSQLRPQAKVNFTVGKDKQYSGQVLAWDPVLDNVTRNVSVRAQVDNVSGDLYPGMFVKVELLTAQQSEVVVIPETAIFYNIYGEAVYVLEDMPAKDDESEATPNEKEKQYSLVSRQVDVIFREKGMVGVKVGVQQGEQVVTSGQNKLFTGMNVVITEDVPEFDQDSLKADTNEANTEA